MEHGLLSGDRFLDQRLPVRRATFGREPGEAGPGRTLAEIG
ncbi:hypothetical protein [Streptosporangium saharense]|uniref:Uncharacterized protein n=1 Tax=Streptosporangium saharense TaxID=1706840 RepID=A0A7W7QV69_9ACTN|nr:hypothetical protein [Streptosporangium saharense]MBB4920361.1 hypothetical protein [Streptosporangium saharense]